MATGGADPGEATVMVTEGHDVNKIDALNEKEKKERDGTNADEGYFTFLFCSSYSVSHKRISISPSCRQS